MVLGWGCHPHIPATPQTPRAMGVGDDLLSPEPGGSGCNGQAGMSTARQGMVWHSTAGHSGAPQLMLSWRVGGGASASLPVLLPTGPGASPQSCPSLPRTPRPPLPAPVGAQRPGPQCWAWPHSAGSPCSVSCPNTGLPKTWKLSLLPQRIT